MFPTYAIRALILSKRLGEERGRGWNIGNLERPRGIFKIAFPISANPAENGAGTREFGEASRNIQYFNKICSIAFPILRFAADLEGQAKEFLRVLGGDLEGTAGVIPQAYPDLVLKLLLEICWKLN